jgi:hypothetical protein
VGGIVLRDDVEAAIALGKPDFDLPRKPGLAPARGEIEILFLADLTAL